MFLGEVRVLHGSLEISVAYRLLHMDGVFLLSQPGGDTTVAKIKNNPDTDDFLGGRLPEGR